MLLIDETYFYGELSLPNIPVKQDLKEPAEDGVALAIQTVSEDNLEVFVDKYVVKFLIKFFGEELTQAFLNGIQEAEPAEIWIDLKNNLLKKFGTLNVSPLANYVYYWLMRDARTKTTTTGEVDPNFTDGNNVNEEFKLIKAWNDMTDMNCSLYNWFYRNIDSYKNYTGCYIGQSIASMLTKINTFGI